MRDSLEYLEGVWFAPNSKLKTHHSFLITQNHISFFYLYYNSKLSTFCLVASCRIPLILLLMVLDTGMKTKIYGNIAIAIT